MSSKIHTILICNVLRLHTRTHVALNRLAPSLYSTVRPETTPLSATYYGYTFARLTFATYARVGQLLHVAVGMKWNFTRGLNRLAPSLYSTVRPETTCAVHEIRGGVLPSSRYAVRACSTRRWCLVSRVTGAARTTGRPVRTERPMQDDVASDRGWYTHHERTPTRECARFVAPRRTVGSHRKPWIFTVPPTRPGRTSTERAPPAVRVDPA